MITFHITKNTSSRLRCKLKISEANTKCCKERGEFWSAVLESVVIDVWIISDIMSFGDCANIPLFLLVRFFQWQHEDVLGPSNQPLSVSIPPRSVILSNMKKKLYKLSQDEAAIVAIQVSLSSFPDQNHNSFWPL